MIVSTKYIGTQEEAAEAYDIAAIKFRGVNAVTNFDMSRYDVKSIANSSLPIGGLSGKNKNLTDSPPSDHHTTKSPDLAARTSAETDRDLSSGNSSVTFTSQPPLPSSTNNNSLTFAIPIKHDTTSDHHYWSSVLAGYNKNPTLIQQSSSTNGSVTSVLPFNVDLSSTNSVGGNHNNNNNGIFNGGSMFVHHQQQNNNNNNNGSGGNGSSSSSGSSSLMIPLGTPIAVNSNPSYETSSGYGNWSIIGHTLHPFQTHATKPTLFQTPIFGME